MPSSPFQRALAGGLILAWVGAFAAGTHAFMRWESTPGASAASAPSAKPAAAWRLTMVAHPQCPCTKASLAVLERIVREGGLQATVLFVGREDSETVRAARRIPGVTVERESAPDSTRDHGARTSGQAFLFDPTGRIRFSGGLTAGRGAATPSSGAAAIRSILLGSDTHAEAPVFGCALFDAETGA